MSDRSSNSESSANDIPKIISSHTRRNKRKNQLIKYRQHIDKIRSSKPNASHSSDYSGHNATVMNGPDDATPIMKTSKQNPKHLFDTSETLQIIRENRADSGEYNDTDITPFLRFALTLQGITPSTVDINEFSQMVNAGEVPELNWIRTLFGRTHGLNKPIPGTNGSTTIGEALSAFNRLYNAEQSNEHSTITPDDKRSSVDTYKNTATYRIYRLLREVPGTTLKNTITKAERSIIGSNTASPNIKDDVLNKFLDRSYFTDVEDANSDADKSDKDDTEYLNTFNRLCAQITPPNPNIKIANEKSHRVTAKYDLTRHFEEYGDKYDQISSESSDNQFGRFHPSDDDLMREFNSVVSWGPNEEQQMKYAYFGNQIKPKKHRKPPSSSSSDSDGIPHLKKDIDTSDDSMNNDNLNYSVRIMDSNNKPMIPLDVVHEQMDPQVEIIDSVPALPDEKPNIPPNAQLTIDQGLIKATDDQAIKALNNGTGDPQTMEEYLNSSDEDKKKYVAWLMLHDPDKIISPIHAVYRIELANATDVKTLDNIAERMKKDYEAKRLTKKEYDQLLDAVSDNFRVFMSGKLSSAHTYDAPMNAEYTNMFNRDFTEYMNQNPFYKGVASFINKLDPERLDKLKNTIAKNFYNKWLHIRKNNPGLIGGVNMLSRANQLRNILKGANQKQMLKILEGITGWDLDKANSVYNPVASVKQPTVLQKLSHNYKKLYGMYSASPQTKITTKLTSQQILTQQQENESQLRTGINELINKLTIPNSYSHK